LDEKHPTAVKREDVFVSAKRYFTGPKGVDPSPSEVGQFLTKVLGELPESRPRIAGRRHWCNIFPPLKDMRARWLKDTGEVIADPPPALKSGASSGTAPEASPDVAPSTYDAPVEGIKITLGREVGECHGDDGIDDAVQKAWESGETDLEQLAAIAEAAASTPKRTPLPTRFPRGALN
jgi:hypothetical protein